MSVDIKSELLQVKSFVSSLFAKSSLQECDKQELVYIIQQIDWMILGDIEINIETIDNLCDIVINATVYQLDLELLQVLSNLGNIKKELSLDEV